MQSINQSLDAKADERLLETSADEHLAIAACVSELQHFDNPADFRRLFSGTGFRQSHFARAMLAYLLRLQP